MDTIFQETDAVIGIKGIRFRGFIFRNVFLGNNWVNVQRLGRFLLYFYKWDLLN